jgi:hypothetical protein
MNSTVQAKAKPPSIAHQSRWTSYLYRLIASEVSDLTSHYDQVIQWLPHKEDTGYLLSQIRAEAKSVVSPGEVFPDLRGETERRTAVLLNGVLNHSLDIQELFSQLRNRLCRTSRAVVVGYNPYAGWLYRLANRLGLRKGPQPTTFVTRST